MAIKISILVPLKAWKYLHKKDWTVSVYIVLIFLGLIFWTNLLFCFFYLFFMPRSRSLDLDNFDLEIERTLKALSKQKEKSMAKHHNEDNVLRDYAMPS